MRVVALIILVFGVALAGGAAFFASEKFREIQAAMAQRAPQAPAAPQMETIDVVVAARPLRYGQVVTPDDLKVVAFPKDSAPSNGFVAIEDILGDGREQRSVLKSIEPNEPILTTKLTAFGERATISAQLQPGFRAFTLKIDAVSGVAGFLLPNDRVDVFLTRGTKGAGMSTDLIMQNVKIIAVDQFSKQSANKARVARTATVEVSPTDAQRLALAQQLGRISLSLRQIDEETTSQNVDPVKIGDVVQIEDTPEPEVVAPVKRGPCTWKGGQRVCE